MNLFRSIPLKNFRSVARILYSPRNPKDASNIELTRSLNSKFWLTTPLISSLMVMVERFTMAEEDSLQKKLHRDWVRNSDSQTKLLKRAFNIESSRYSNCFILENHRFDSPRQSLNRKKIITCGDVCHWKLSISFLASESTKSWNVDFVLLRVYNSKFSVKKTRIFPSNNQVSMENSLVGK